MDGTKLDLLATWTAAFRIHPIFGLIDHYNHNEWKMIDLDVVTEHIRDSETWFLVEYARIEHYYEKHDDKMLLVSMSVILMGPVYTEFTLWVDFCCDENGFPKQPEIQAEVVWNWVEETFPGIDICKQDC